MKAVLLDLGRVLIHYDHALTMRGLAGLAGCSEQEMLERFGLIRDDLELGRTESVGLHRWFAEQAGMAAGSNGFDAFFTAFTCGMARDEEALAYVASLEQRPDVLVAAISNTNETHIRWLDANVPELEAFDLVMYSSEVGMGKPDPALFRLALELLDVRPEAAIFIDDVESNVRAAEAIGIHGLVHTDWATTRPQLEAWLAG
jgi:FMN phosphatase YigB (HAD superfamily)